MALEQLLKFLSDKAREVICFESPDLTTNNTASPPAGPTTPPDNSLAGFPEDAFTPQTDCAVVSPDPANRAPITKAIPGVQVQAWFANYEDPAAQARFLLRFPHQWNGKLVVAGASGTRSEFNGDFAWSDFVLQKGYAYASQNKGMLNRYVSTASDPLACRLNPASTTYVHFYANDPDKPFTRWTDFMIHAAQLAQDAAAAHYGHAPRRTYAVGISNGGYQVRRAMENAPGRFDGGVDWEGTFVDPERPNLLSDLAPVLRNFPAYAASGFDRDSEAAQKIVAAGYPPDMVVDGKSLWGLYWDRLWEASMAQWQKRLDPAFDTYAAGLENYHSALRASDELKAALRAIATTGKIKKPLVSVAGTMDALLPIKLHARAYRARVLAAHNGEVPYRLYEVQNGNHIDPYRLMFQQLEFMEPHAHRAFDLLVDHVENGAPLPPDQCIPRGGTISATPGEPGQAGSLFKP